jgi:hypothetical protein
VIGTPASNNSACQSEASAMPGDDGVGLTRTNAVRQLLQICDSQIHNQRSYIPERAVAGVTVGVRAAGAAAPSIRDKARDQTNPRSVSSAEIRTAIIVEQRIGRWDNFNRATQNRVSAGTGARQRIEYDFVGVIRA